VKTKFHFPYLRLKKRAILKNKLIPRLYSRRIKKGELMEGLGSKVPTEIV
jgi:hypothetical protein